MKLKKFADQRESIAPVELPQDIPEENIYFDIRDVCEGLKVWKNPKNQFTVARLHYEADPRKRSPEWRAMARAGLTWAEWMREYEIVWSSFDGVPVYGDDFARGFHVSLDPLRWDPRYPVIRGWDFGLSAGGMACVFAQLLAQSRLFVYKEVTASDTDLEHFAPEVNRLSREWFPECIKWFDIVDHSGFYNRNQHDKRTSAAIVNAKCGTRCQPGERSIVARRKAVTEFLQRNVKGLPCLVLDGSPEGVLHLISGFEGGYHYAFAKDGQLKDEAEKNEHSHDHDALQMIAAKVKTLNLTRFNSDLPATPGGVTRGKWQSPRERQYA